MGFNLAVSRAENGKLVYRHLDRAASALYGCTCGRGSRCSCEYGIDIDRHVGDREFFSRLLSHAVPHEWLDFYPLEPGQSSFMHDPESHVRPTDFAAARRMADELAAELGCNGPRFRGILDHLEAHPELWLDGHS